MGGVPGSTGSVASEGRKIQGAADMTLPQFLVMALALDLAIALLVGRSLGAKGPAIATYCALAGIVGFMGPILLRPDRPIATTFVIAACQALTIVVMVCSREQNRADLARAVMGRSGGVR